MRIFGRNGHSKPALDHPKLPSLRNIIVAKIQFSFFLFAMLVATVAQAEKRVALVIGNSAYDFNPLVNPGADATAIAELLGDLNFEVFKGLDLVTSNCALLKFRLLSLRWNALHARRSPCWMRAGTIRWKINLCSPWASPVPSPLDVALRTCRLETAQ